MVARNRLDPFNCRDAKESHFQTLDRTTRYRYLWPQLGGYLFSQIRCIDLSTCFRDRPSKRRIYPDVSQGFKDGYVNTYYEQVAQVNILSDTVIDLGTGPVAATISYVVIDSVAGMPSGFSYKCNTVDCKIMGGGNGCTLMYGTPILADVNKTFNLTIYS